MLETLWQSVIQNWLEEVAVIVSIAGVWLTAKEKIISWPVGIVACAIYTYIFYVNLLYGDTALQVFYVVISFYGWYEWAYGGQKHTSLHVSISSKRTLLILSILSVAGWLVLGKILTHTNTNVPYWDGLNTALSLIATWMTAKKLIENWLVWIVTDLSYVILYFYKDLKLTSFLYFIFTLLAIYGYYQWKKQLKTTSPA